GITLGFDGPDAHLLVGRAGRTLDALQYLASNVVNRRGGRARLHVIFDADSYRARREVTLKQLAADLAAQVASTGQEAVLDPLSPLERRIVHNALKDQPGVRTYSEGEEPERYIIISPAA
ncbi:MAG: KH domain-containing protein, partial [Cytophagales bacterium]|nr:KH domain-containing protein [Armatimonadota bacterium]